MLQIVLPTLALALGAGEGDAKLEIANARGTYGYLGAKRPPSGVLPGETVNFSFDIKNLKLDANGRAIYSLAVEIYNDKGELLHRQNPQNATAQSNFGGNTLPVSSSIQIPIDAKPGELKWKITVEDRAAKQSVSLEGKGKILSPEFGLVQIGTFADRDNRAPINPVGVVGGHLYIHFAAVHFGRGANKEPDLEVSLRVLDDKGKPTMPQPLKGHVNKDIPESVKIIPLQFGLTMNRPGNFTIEINAQCVVCGKTSSVRIPVRVLPAE